MPPEAAETVNGTNSLGSLVLVLGVLLALFATALFALRTWFRNSAGLGSQPDDLPTAEQRDLVSLVEVARYADQTQAALERERAARKSTEDALTRSRSLLERTLAERLRLGRELHDDTCQVLYGVTLHLDALLTHVGERAPDLQAGLARSLDQLRALNRRVRAHVDNLEASPVPESTWGSLLAEAAAPFSGIPGLRLALEIAPPFRAVALPAARAEDVVSCVREAHANALRHGAATEILTRLSEVEGRLTLTVSDNGRGFDPASVRPGHGLSNLAARAERLGGAFRADSAPGGPTRLVFSWKGTSLPE